MNGEPEPSKLSSSCSKMPPHVHLDHIGHNEDRYSHHEQQMEQPMERPVKHKGDKQQLSTERLKLITKSSQEVIRVMKLKSSLLILA
jgi:hypothetical protein